tara:strand:- start:1137 stop:1322 length:186 start_codon:yes stop_codon:yes gene_type:complete
MDNIIVEEEEEPSNIRFIILITILLCISSLITYIEITKNTSLLNITYEDILKKINFEKILK